MDERREGRLDGSTGLGAAFALRPETESDRPFLLRLFADVRRQEMALVPWPEEAKRRFLEDQFRLQDIHYRTHYPKASFQIVELAGQPIGRLYLWRNKRDLRVIDISILEPHRRRGLGRALLSEALERAAAAGWTASLSVAPFNPARALYSSLGFVAKALGAAAVEMVWTPPVRAATAKPRGRSRRETTAP